MKMEFLKNISKMTKDNQNMQYYISRETQNNIFISFKSKRFIFQFRLYDSFSTGFTIHF